MDPIHTSLKYFCNLSNDYNVQGGWDTWGKEEDEVTRQIREYRTSLATARQKQNEPEEPEVQADYFQDMIPRVTKAPRVKLSAQEEQVDVSRSSLMFAAQPMPIVVCISSIILYFADLTASIFIFKAKISNFTSKGMKTLDGSIIK
ncbi:Hypothetical predicted protein [Cloeon dipterum]|uniref:Rhodanese domain-containing protein n=1 Tax=Cloeon dipterum TaxID=197152 RepID=A0A8S1CG55_9INSE|nr:Hypothetical predicted protein [Cloeon dipterum]